MSDQQPPTLPQGPSGDGDSPAATGKTDDLDRPEIALAGPRIIVKQPVLTRIQVFREGELVVLSIGNQQLKIPYEIAAQIGQGLLKKAGEVKRLRNERGPLIPQETKAGKRY